ncbi:hypothetical protein Tco_0816595 [Tanacetum coccineum]
MVDEFVDEGIPAVETRFGDEEADMRKVVEESLKDAYVAPRGPLPPVVIREPEPGKYEPLPETPKKKNSTEQFIFQRCTPAPTIPWSHEESSSLHVVHVGPNLEHMNLEVSDTSPQLNPEQMDAKFTTMAYPNVQENLKLLLEGEVRREEPASSAGTLSSMQNLDKELSFTNQFTAKKSQEDELEKINTEVKVQSMVTVPIHQDTSSVPLMTSPIIDLIVSQPASTTVQALIPTSTEMVTTTTTTTNFPPPPPQPQQGVSNSIIIQRIGELE